MAGQGASLGAERLFQQDVLHSVGSHWLVENDGCTEMTTDPKDAEIARLVAELAESEAAAEGAFMILAQTQAERDKAQTDLGRIIMSLPTGKGERAAGAVEGVKMMRARLEAERDAALAQVARLHHLIREASDPDFIWGAMDNVNDMDADITEFANAASRAIRASIPILAAAEKEKGNG